MSIGEHGTDLFRHARDSLLAGATSLIWPHQTPFNWALDWFDVAAPEHLYALIVCDADGAESASYGELRELSNQVANWMDAIGVACGDRVLLVMHNSIDYYAVTLALMKMGAVSIPCFTSLPIEDIADRAHRAGIKHLVADAALATSLQSLRVPGQCIAAGVGRGLPAGWLSLRAAEVSERALAHPWRGDSAHPLMGFFTSGTTARPKLAMHSHQSYPVGHLSSLRWQGIGKGDVHANVSAPGWAKHAWSSFFVPFSAEATALVFNQDPLTSSACLRALEQFHVSSLCAPPSFWRTLLRHGLGVRPSCLRNIVCAGEGLDDRVVAALRDQWQLELRDGYGQSELTAVVGFVPEQHRKPGALGYVLPGYENLQLIDPLTGMAADEGEMCIPLEPRPVGLMLGYIDDTGQPSLPPGKYFRTGDLAQREPDGCLRLIGRADDVFKSYDVRVSPVEIEHRFRLHPGLTDIAVFDVRDEHGELVPAGAVIPDRARDPAQFVANLLDWQTHHLPPSQHLRRVWLVEHLPRTANGKVHRTALRRSFSAPSPNQPHHQGIHP